MDSLFNRIQSSNANKELFKAFIDTRTRLSMAAPEKKINNDGYFAKYRKALKNPQSNEFRFTVAGMVALVLGGTGFIFGGRKNLIKLSKNLGNLADRLKEQTPGTFIKIKQKIAEGAKKTIDSLYAMDKSKDTGFMQALKALDKGFEKIKLPFIKPGKWIIKASKASLWVTGNRLKKRYWKPSEQSVNELEKIIQKKWGSLSGEEQKSLTEAQKFLKEGQLQNSIANVVEGTKDRLGKIRNEIDEKIIKNYTNTYFPNFKKIFTKKERRRIVNNWKRAFSNGTPDVLRKHWGDKEVEKTLIANIEKTGSKGAENTFGQSLDEFSNIIEKLDEFKEGRQVSNGFKNIYKKLKSAKGNIDSAIKFETAGRKRSYAGRAIDLGAGGGISETLVPIVTGGIISYKSVKDSDKSASLTDVAKKFMKTGGLEFLGGLGAWGVTVVMFAVSGGTAIAASALTAVGLHIAKRAFEKLVNKKEDVVKEN